MVAGDISPMLLVSIRWVGTLFLLLVFAGRLIKKDLKSNLLKDANISWQRNDYHHLTVYFVGDMEPDQLTQMNH